MNREEEFYKYVMGMDKYSDNIKSVHPSSKQIDTFIHRCIEEKDYTYPELYNEYQCLINNTGKYQNRMVSGAMVALAPDILKRLTVLIKNPDTKLDID